MEGRGGGQAEVGVSWSILVSDAYCTLQCPHLRGIPRVCRISYADWHDWLKSVRVR